MPENTPANGAPEKEIPSSPAVEESKTETHHTITLHGEKIDYTVTTGTIILKEEDVEEGEKQKASIYYMAERKDNPEAERPFAFSFNGGPGPSSV